jgi:putative DNA primase/helicase
MSAPSQPRSLDELRAHLLSDENVLPDVSGASVGPQKTGPDEMPEEDQSPSDMTAEDMDFEAVRDCAGLDHSDTDNGRRLIRHFGQDLRVMAQEGVINMDYLAWCGTHWDGVTGNDRVRAITQQLGSRIAMEAAYLGHTPDEALAIKAAASADGETNEGLALIEAARAAKKALESRKTRRRAFGVTSKNTGRIESALKTAAPHLLRHPDDWNPDPLACATATHTLRFKVTEADDPEHPTDWKPTRKVEVVAEKGHRRGDFITHIVPVAYDARATCPEFRKFMTRFQPDDGNRLAIQVATGAALLGTILQRFFFHFGSGANGKSIYLETISRVLGGLGIGLPQESITGTGQGGGGQASPDIARLYGKRFIRVLELAKDEPLKEAMIKKLSGGERLPARSLFKGFFEFQPIGKVHGSGNGYPKIDGTDNGIWRRITVFEWPIQLTEGDMREFEEVMADFKPEYPGILNWLIEGACIFLRDGFVPSESVRTATRHYREEMDPIVEFVRNCTVKDDTLDEYGEPVYAVQARVMFEGYRRWAYGNSRMAIKEARFGRLMPQHYERTEERVRRYLRCRLDLSGLPDLPFSARNPDDGS